MLGVTAWRGILRICIGVARIVYHGAGYAGGGSSPPVRICLAATVKGCSAVPRLRTISRGRAVWQARRVHTPKVAGSNPAFAICRERIINQLDGGNAVQGAPVVRWVLFLCQFRKEGKAIKGESYDEFVEKIKPKKTTDDCYTPPEIYEVIKGWVCEKYKTDPSKILRPFWPGGTIRKKNILMTVWFWTIRHFRFYRRYVNFT